MNGPCLSAPSALKRRCFRLALVRLGRLGEPAKRARALGGRLVAVAQPVAHQAERVRAALGVVARTVRAAGIPLKAGHAHRLGEHRLSERGSGERRRVEARERVERVALHFRARHRGIEEPEVKGGVVADEDRAPAGVIAHPVTDFSKHALQRVALRQRRPQRVIRVDAGDRKGQRRCGCPRRASHGNCGWRRA